MYKVSAQSDRATAEKLSDILAEMDPSPAEAVSTEEVSHVTWRIDAFCHFEDAAEACIAIMEDNAPGLQASFEKLEDKDWVAESLRGLPAVTAGPFYVAGAHELNAYWGGRIPIWIEAGPAFGTGHHGTTMGCLVALAKLARRKRLGKVLDLGTGSGVLAIGAMKLGAHSAIGTDIDEQSIWVSYENAFNNRMDHRLKLVVADGARLKLVRDNAPYDTIMANILARPLVSLAPDVVSLVKPSGHVVLSGLLHHQRPQVIGAYAGRGLNLIERMKFGPWSTLVFQRSKPKPAPVRKRRKRNAAKVQLKLG